MGSYETDGNRPPRAHTLAQAMIEHGSLDRALNEMTKPAEAVGPFRHPKIDQPTIQAAINLLRRQGYEGHAATLETYERKTYPPRGRLF